MIMKRFRIMVEDYIINMGQQWKALPQKNRRICMTVFFTGYILLMLQIAVWLNVF